MIANSKLSSRPSELGTVHAILDDIQDDPEAEALARKLFEIPSTRDLNNVRPPRERYFRGLTGQVTDPSPRISILHALSSTSSYTPAPPVPAPAAPETPSKRLKSKRRVSPPPPSKADEPSRDNHGDVKGLEILYGLWKGAGRSVNLWDWYTGYLGAFTIENDHEDEDEVDEGDEPARISLLRKQTQKRKRTLEEDDEATKVGPDTQHAAEGEEAEEGEKRDRLHASFVRFCEEARMLGTVRARGKGVGRRADEVVKGVTLV